MDGIELTTQIMDRPKILTISSDEILLNDIKEYLEEANYEFRKTDSDVINIKNALEKSPDLILLDADEKNIDLVKFSKYIESYNIPHIVIVGMLFDEILDKVLESSPYNFLIKDIDKEELQRSIAVALKKHAQNTQNIIDAKNKVNEKKSELIIEKSSSIALLALCIFLILLAIFTRDATWLQWILLIPTVFMLINACASLKKQDELKKIEDGDELPFVSIFIPAHNEENTIKATVESVANIDYHYDGKPQYEIIVINDGSTDLTGEILSSIKNNIPHLKIITRRPPRSGKGKGFVLNDALTLSKGEIIGVFDADTHVKPNYLKTIIPYLHDDIDGVQSRVKMFNKNENYLARMQHLEFASFGNTLIAKDNLGKTGFLGGNGQFVKKESIIKCGRWDGFAVTEDLNLAVKILIDGGKINYCGECAVYQEAILDWKSLFKQRIRWAIGNFETLFIYFPDILKAKIPIAKKLGIIEHISFYSFNLLIFFGFIVSILNIITWFFLGNMIVIKMDAPIIVGLLSFISFFPGNIIAFSRDKPGIITLIKDIFKYYLYSYHLIPLFFMTMDSMITRKERTWAKTVHKGRKHIDSFEEIPESKQISSNNIEPIKSDEDKETYLINNINKLEEDLKKN